jgi:hypothetical protein
MIAGMAAKNQTLSPNNREVSNRKAATSDTTWE